jgi:hypothetical protein
VKTALIFAALAAAVPAAAVTTHAHHTVVVDEHTSQTVTVHKGDRVRLVLHSTYWTIDPAHGSALRTAGAQKTEPRLAGCIPGGGCGTATRTFVARALGRGKISAARTTCGEALRCIGDQGSFELTVRVVRERGGNRE